MLDLPAGPRWETAFSTLGCPEADAAEVAELARSSGCTGVELRCAPPEGLLTPESTAAERSRLVARLGRAGVRGLWVSSYLRAADVSTGDEEWTAQLDALVRLATDIGALGIRLFPGARQPGPLADAVAVRRLRTAAARMSDTGPRLLLETHDSHPRATDVARVLAAVDHPSVGAVWDVLHTWRAGESCALSATVLDPWLYHVQIKDVATRDDLRPVLPGQGTVPLHEVPAALAAVGYRGWLCLEWEKRWFPDAPGLPEALRHAAGVLERTVPLLPHTTL
ncbi:sugar phosphate isomerase/epimerase family protein [Streptomyces flaveolus]|uniref:sugar phosphate isomerase/epimerase family protein n=1 Tax=Streptomyces flaveolus TaxID=67297 RepID=UPI0036FF5E38